MCCTHDEFTSTELLTKPLIWLIVVTFCSEDLRPHGRRPGRQDRKFGTWWLVREWVERASANHRLRDHSLGTFSRACVHIYRGLWGKNFWEFVLLQVQWNCAPSHSCECVLHIPANASEWGAVHDNEGARVNECESSLMSELKQVWISMSAKHLHRVSTFSHLGINLEKVALCNWVQWGQDNCESA